MGADIVQIQYERLASVANQFDRDAESAASVQQQIQRSAQALREGGWQGRGSTAFFAELDGTALPALHRLISALKEAQKVTLQVGYLIRQAEEEAARPFKSGETLSTQPQVEYLGNSQPLFAMANLGAPVPAGPPPIPVPGDPTNEWKWNPNPQNSRGGSWGPKQPIPGQGQPSGSWDPDAHWDVDDGKGNRQRHDPNGKPISPEEAHGDRPRSNPSKFEIPPELMDKAAKIIGLTGTALIIYLIVSEGSRVLFPPRNLIPVP